MKTIKKLLILAIVILATCVQADESFDLEAYKLNEQTQVNLMKYLEQRFSFGSSIDSKTPRRFYAYKMTYPEQVLLMNQMMRALGRIKYPKQLPQMFSIEAGGEDSNYVLGGAKTYQEDGRVYLAKSTNWLQLIYIFSEKPYLEDNFSTMMDAFAANLFKNMSLSLKNDTQKNYLPVFEAFKKYCSEPDSNVFRENLVNNLLKNNFLESGESDQEKSYILQNENTEFTIKNSNGNIDRMDFVFAVSKQEKIEFTFSRPCLIKEYQLVLKDSAGQIKKRIFLDYDMRIQKIANNNVPKITSAEIEAKEKKLALRKDRVGIAIYDSGVDYNHVDLAPYLFYKDLTADEKQKYEDSKSYYVNRNKNEADLNNRIKVQEERKNYVLMKENDYANSEKENETLNQNSQENIKKIQENIKSKEQEKENLIVAKSHVEKTFLQKILQQTNYEEVKLSQQIEDLDNLINFDLKVKLQEEIENSEKASKNMTDLKNVLSTFTQEENAKYSDEMKKINEQEQVNKTKLADFVKGVTAWDYSDDDDLPYDYWNHPQAILNKSFDHGTHVAGIIIRDTEDLFIFPMKSGGINDYDALKLASEEGINIVNISMGTTNDGKTEEEIEKNNDPTNSGWIGIKNAAEELPDLIVVAAAGNEGNDNDIKHQYPGSFDLPNIIAVASVGNDGKLSSFSNYGKNTVHLAAPGENIESLVEGGKRGIKSGTSMATPFVTRVVGIMRFINPQLSAEDIKEILRVSVVKTEELKEKTIFGGYVDPKKTFLETCKSIDQNRARTLSYCQK